MLVDLEPLVLEALELGAHLLRKPGDASADLAVLSVGAFFLFHVCVYVLHFLCEGKKEEPAQVVEPRETVDVPLSFGDNVVRRTSCQHLQQHLQCQCWSSVSIGHTYHAPFFTHFQP